jgi:hypothetical protein
MPDIIDINIPYAEILARQESGAHQAFAPSPLMSATAISIRMIIATCSRSCGKNKVYYHRSPVVWGTETPS